MKSAPVQVTTTYVTSVDTLPAAWAFVMEYVEQVGSRPQISITPRTIFGFDQIGEGEGVGQEVFEVVVSGMTERGEHA